MAVDKPDRPEWLERRFSWWFGEKPVCPIAIREPELSDIAQLRRLVHDAGYKISSKTFRRLINDNTAPCHIAVRNHRIAVGYAFAFITPAGCTVKQIYVDPRYRGAGIEARLLALLTLELPEQPSRFTSRLSNDYHRDIFSDWHVESADETADTVTYITQYIRQADETAFPEDS